MAGFLTAKAVTTFAVTALPYYMRAVTRTPQIYKNVVRNKKGASQIFAFKKWVILENKTH